MPTPKAFVEDDPARLHALMQRHTFGTLVVPNGDQAPDLAHLPFLFDPARGTHGELRFHVARGNAIWETAMRGHPLVVVFHGPHGYVSPTWYEHPARQVPTWNYAVVHAHGRATGLIEGTELSDVVRELSTAYEGSSAAAWDASVLDPAFLERLLQGIVGIRVAVERLEGRFKLSQNRSATDVARVVQAFRDRGTADDREMVELMRGGQAKG